MNRHADAAPEAGPDSGVTTFVAALSDSALRGTSSSAIFQRGLTYASSGAVEVTSEEPGSTPAIFATVTGTEPYSTEVWVRDGEVGGRCDCANAQDGWFCKHQVALALVWRERLSGKPSIIDEQARTEVESSAKRTRSVKDRRQALEEFLQSQPASILADRLLGLADRDPEIDRELQQWRQLSEAPQEAAELKALVAEIMSPGHDFISWRESHGYVHRAGAVLPLLVQTRARDPATAASLCLHAMRRGWVVLMQADDSEGEIGGLIQSIGAEWVQALKQCEPQPAAFGDTYLQLLLDDPFGCFDTEAAEAAMGVPALARFRKVLATRWREAKASVLAARTEHAALAAQAVAKGKRAPYLARNSQRDMRLTTLERMHVCQLEAEGDIDGALAVMREDLTGPGAYHRITEFLERHGRLREAFANAELGCKVHPDAARLQEDLLRCYERDGWVEEAFALRRRQFQQEPGVERYHEVLKAGAAAARDSDGLRTELHAELIAQEVETLTRSASRQTLYGYRHGADAGQRDVSLRTEVLCSERRWDEAVALVRPPAYCRDGVLVYLARRLGPEHLAQRVELLMRVFASEMHNAKSPYRRELALVKEISDLLDGPRRDAWLLKLRMDYKAKKNFVRGLPER